MALYFVLYIVHYIRALKQKLNLPVQVILLQWIHAHWKNKQIHENEVFSEKKKTETDLLLQS